ncbi:Potassium voltage-gated channel protein Shal [Frankliniella fusca]|uniref:Potassium voltage-gated channel protein Shal n=1 Tax=Frankliniella fusca TaxID=407009 RepID=A0AAE1I1M0_9NEOP|nr:Potassium voltage-gated channel protein Shal [Frankliniella fusca]
MGNIDKFRVWRNITVDDPLNRTQEFGVRGEQLEFAELVRLENIVRVRVLKPEYFGVHPEFIGERTLFYPENARRTLGERSEYTEYIRSMDREFVEMENPYNGQPKRPGSPSPLASPVHSTSSHTGLLQACCGRCCGQRYQHLIGLLRKPNRKVKRTA